MKSAVCVLSLCLAMGGLLTTRAVAQQAVAGQSELKVGDPAPDFTLPATDGRNYTLSKLRGKTVVLAWFPKAYTAG